MSDTARNFCRGFGSVMEVQPRTGARHVFVSYPGNRRIVTEHFQDCWRFVTGNMREVALKVLVDDDLVQGLSEYFKECPTLTSPRQSPNPNGQQKECRLHENKGQLDLFCLDRQMREAPGHGTNGHRNANT